MFYMFAGELRGIKLKNNKTGPIIYYTICQDDILALISHIIGRPNSRPNKIISLSQNVN